MKQVKKLWVILLALAMFLPGFTKVAEAAEAVNSSAIERLEGSNRAKTSIEVSNKVYSAGSTENVVLAGWDGQVDALTATLLASVKDAPVLLVRNDEYSNIEKELKRLGVKNVYIAGGKTVVSKDFESNLKRDKYQVKRLAGSNRYYTASEIMKEAGGNSKHVFLVNSGAEEEGKLADALSVGPVSGKNKLPILLTLTNKLPETTKDALKGVDRITIIGGNESVSDKVESELKAGGYTVDRVKGNNRHHTAVEIAEKYFNGTKNSILANDGKVSFADALVGGYLGAKKEVPVLLTNAGELTGYTQGYIENKITFSYVLGGPKSISVGVFNKLEETINPIIKRTIESIETFKNVEVKFGEKYSLPTTVEIRLSDKEVTKVPVKWNNSAVDTKKPGTYKVDGRLDLSKVKDIEEAAKKMMSTINIVVAKKVEVEKAPFRVVLDYGHGGTDSGAVYQGRREKDDVLRLGKLVRAELLKQGIEVDETRKGDETVSLWDRSRFANRNGKNHYNYFVSIHRNAFNNVAEGSETWVYTSRTPLSVALATDVQKGLTRVGFTDRGVKHKSFHVLRETYAPAVLIEVGFMDNDADNKLFDDNIEKIAKSIADAVMLQAK